MNSAKRGRGSARDVVPEDEFPTWREVGGIGKKCSLIKYGGWSHRKMKFKAGLKAEILIADPHFILATAAGRFHGVGTATIMSF